MKRMKKWLVFALTAVMLFTGCGTKDTADTDTTQTATENGTAFPEEMYGDDYVVEEALADVNADLALDKEGVGVAVTSREKLSVKDAGL